MSQHDMNIANAVFATVRSDINDALQALASTSGGSSRPGTPYAGQLWIKNVSATQNELYIYDGADDLLIATFNYTANTIVLNVQAATASVLGAVTLATTAEALAGTDTVKVVTPAGLAAATLMQGKWSIFVPASAMLPRTTSGAEASSAELSSNKIMQDYLAFDQATAEYAQFGLAMPKNWDEGTVTFIPVWTAASGSGDVIWGLQGLALGDNDAMDAAMGTAQTSTDTLLATNKLHRGPVSSAITIAGSPAAEDWVQFQVYRDAAAGGDTLSGDALLLGVVVYITLNAATEV